MKSVDFHTNPYVIWMWIVNSEHKKKSHNSCGLIKKKKTRVNGAEQWSNRSINWHCHIGGIVRMGEWAFVRACAAVKHWNICLKALLHLNQAKYVRSLFLNGPSNIRSTISESNYCVGIAQKKINTWSLEHTHNT